jgi:Flp pilus assembly protein CpaB
MVARTDILPGHEITAADVIEAQVESVPAESFKDVQLLVGRTPEFRITKGAPILESMLTPAGSGAGIVALVPKGMRAITVEVNEFSGVAGLLVPGCRVDVISTMQNNDGKQVARTIVQNVKVQAVGQRLVANPPPADSDNNKGAAAPPEVVRSVTLIAKPKEAESIELAASMGRPRLVLRSQRDEDVEESAGITIGELSGGSKNSTGGGFWESAFAFMAHAATQPSVQPAPVQTAQAAPATTQPANIRTVKVYRQGVESIVQMELPPVVKDTANNGAVTDTKSELLTPAAGK